MVQYLCDLLGPDRVARLSGTASVRRVNKWAKGKGRASPVVIKRLTTAYMASSFLSYHLGQDVARDWFDWENAALGYRTPADVIRKGCSGSQLPVVKAARAFAVYGSEPDAHTGNPPLA